MATRYPKEPFLADVLLRWKDGDYQTDTILVGGENNDEIDPHIVFHCANVDEFIELQDEDNTIADFVVVKVESVSLIKE